MLSNQYIYPPEYSLNKSKSEPPSKNKVSPDPEAKDYIAYVINNDSESTCLLDILKPVRSRCWIQYLEDIVSSPLPEWLARPPVLLRMSDRRAMMGNDALFEARDFAHKWSGSNDTIIAAQPSSYLNTEVNDDGFGQIYTNDAEYIYAPLGDE